MRGSFLGLTLPLLLLPAHGSASPFSFTVISQFSSTPLVAIDSIPGTFAAGVSIGAEASKYFYFPPFIGGFDNDLARSTWVVAIQLQGPAGVTTDVRVGGLTSGSLHFETGQETGTCPLLSLPGGVLQGTAASSVGGGGLPASPLVGILADDAQIQTIVSGWTNLGNPPNLATVINSPGVVRLNYNGEPVPTGMIGTNGSGPCPPDWGTVDLYSFVMVQFPMTVGDILVFSGEIAAYGEARIFGFDTHALARSTVSHAFIATTEFPEPATFGLFGAAAGVMLMLRRRRVAK